MANPSLRITDYNDREVLRVIYELSDDDGWTDLETIAWHFFHTSMKRGGSRRKSAMHCVSGRLSYMKRIGLVNRRVLYNKEENTKYTQWTLTKVGESFLLKKLTPPQRRAIETAISDNASMLEMADVIASHYIDDLANTATVVLRRTWQYSYGKRRRRFG